MHCASSYSMPSGSSTRYSSTYTGFGQGLRSIESYPAQTFVYSGTQSSLRSFTTTGSFTSDEDRYAANLWAMAVLVTSAVSWVPQSLAPSLSSSTFWSEKRPLLIFFDRAQAAPRQAAPRQPPLARPPARNQKQIRQSLQEPVYPLEQQQGSALALVLQYCCSRVGPGCCIVVGLWLGEWRSEVSRYGGGPAERQPKPPRRNERTYELDAVPAGSH